jgi:ankyrin repeat protein
MICPHNKMSNGSTLQHKAADHGHDLMLYFLGELGANMNSQDEAGQTPLHIATTQEKYDSVRFLLSLGSEVNLPNKSN